MKTGIILSSLALMGASVLAAPSKGSSELVGENYPAWTGITAKNYVTGRALLTGADLRQRVATIIVEFDAEKAQEQLDATGSLANLIRLNEALGLGASNWETLELPRDVMVVFVAKNVKTRDVIKEALKIKGEKDAAKYPGITAISSNKASIYENVTFDGAPSGEGKYPFVYVMGFEGKEPLVKETWTDKKTMAAIRKAMKEQRSKLDEDSLKWRMYYGYVAEPKHFGKDIEKAMAKGKPLVPVQAKILKSVTSKDAETAKEAQMLYDGLEQTKSDLVWQIQNCYSACPHVAAYKMSVLLKYWPNLKKQVGSVADKLKANSAAQPLIKMYPKIAQWADPAFTCKNAGEAKKIVLELQKMKKTLETLKEDKNIQVQNGALILDGMLDELINVIPAKVPQK